MTTCDIPADLVSQFRKWSRTRDVPAAFIIKIDRDSLSCQFDEEHAGLDLEELQEELPPSSPRFIGYIFEHDVDGHRKTYPMVMIFYMPPTNAEQATLYTSTKIRLEAALNIQRSYQIGDIDELTDEWLFKKFSKF
eukprot:TRINITY_DN173_c0_g1_i1.p1 TRINITY_DN173_c0_g1~~TRINITY_DN173_c0_g1_i1.p1  ORF type:complete len:136 (-),score=30.16 TRINITY_DN173_c0_g1_i1:28-435(-)